MKISDSFKQMCNRFHNDTVKCMEDCIVGLLWLDVYIQMSQTVEFRFHFGFINVILDDLIEEFE